MQADWIMKIPGVEGASNNFTKFVEDINIKLEDYRNSDFDLHQLDVQTDCLNAIKEELSILKEQSKDVIEFLFNKTELNIENEYKNVKNNTKSFSNDVNEKMSIVKEKFGINVSDLKKNINDLRSDFNNKVVFLTRTYGIALEPRGFRFGVEEATIEEKETYYKARNYEPLPFAVNGTLEENTLAIGTFKIEKHNEVLERFGLDKDTPYGDPLKMKYTDAGIFYKENLDMYSPFIALKFL